MNDPRARLELTRRPGLGPGAEILGSLHGATVVELGCGSGHNTAHLAAACPVAHAIGVDHSRDAVERARRLYGHLPRASFIHSGAYACMAGLPPRSADVCLSVFGAFSFTAEPGPLLGEAARVLKPSGRLLVVLRAGAFGDYVVMLTKNGP